MKFEPKTDQIPNPNSKFRTLALKNRETRMKFKAKFQKLKLT